MHGPLELPLPVAFSLPQTAFSPCPFPAMALLGQGGAARPSAPPLLYDQDYPLVAQQQQHLLLLHRLSARWAFGGPRVRVGGLGVRVLARATACTSAAHLHVGVPCSPGSTIKWYGRPPQLIQQGPCCKDMLQNFLHCVYRCTTIETSL